MKINKLETMKAVYTYFFPEVRELIASMEHIDSKLLLTTTKTKEGQEILNKFNFKKKIKITANPEGKIDIDYLHEPVIAEIVKIYRKIIPNLKDFKYVYPTAGSSEGLFHAIAEQGATGTNEILTLSG